MSQNGKAGRDVIQVGRDYFRYLQVNIQAGNWLIVLTNFLVIFFLLGVIGFGIKLGIQSPSNEDLEKSLQGELPQNLNVEKLELEKTDNTGTIADPTAVSRFHTVAALKEDSFSETSEKIGSLPLYKQKDVIFLRKTGSRGEKVSIYGVATSHHFKEGWKTEFRFDSPPAEKGYPRSQFNGKTVVKGTSEEEQFVSRIKAEIQTEREALISIIRSGHSFEGNRSLDGGGNWDSFSIQFQSFDESSDAVTGQVIWADGKGLEFSGSLSASELTLNLTRSFMSEQLKRALILPGLLPSGDIRSGTMFTLYSKNSGELTGRWSGPTDIAQEGKGGILINAGKLK